MRQARGIGFCMLLCLLLLSACQTLPNNLNADTTKKNKSALINTQLGISYLQRQQIQLAKQKLLLALAQAPTLPEPWYAMAFYQEVTGDNVKANEYYLKALALAPQNGEAHNNYGTYLCRRGKYGAAIEQFTVAVQDQNYLDTASAYENAGLCALKLPDRNLAVSYFRKALGQDPNMPTSTMELAALAQQNRATPPGLTQVITKSKTDHITTLNQSGEGRWN